MDKQKTQAFTLVELIVVITILAILGTIAFISLQGYSIQARDSTRISDLGSMKTSLELFQLEAGKYPLPTNGVDVTYSGATVWSQGSFGDTVYSNVSKLDKIPTDPLTDKQYTYSVTATRNQYQLGGMVEGDEVALGGLTTAHAGTTEAYAYIAGTYNEQMTKSLSGTTCNVLAVPSIITNDTTVTDLQQIISSGSLVYRGYKNLPASFKGSKFKANGGFEFEPNNLVAYTDNNSCEPLTDKSSYTARVQLLEGLQTAYSGTLLQNEGEIKNIVALTIDVNNLSQEAINYAGNYVNNVLGGNIVAGELKTNYVNCEASTINGYNYLALNHYTSQNVTKSLNIANGTQNYGAQANCNNGTVTLTDENSNIVCTSGYVEQAGACVQDICNSTVPTNAHSTATSQSVSITWIHNTTPGVCTFVCDTNYTWNGSSCTANTQLTSCTGKPTNTVWNTASSITQTWNGTIWSPVESGNYNTTASTTTCNYKCDVNYTWDGSSCIANTQTVTCGSTIPTNATASTATTYMQTWNGTTWTPTMSWGQSQATCDFNCNSGYDWNGSSCVITGWRALDANCDIPDIIKGSQVWAGCNSTLGTGIEYNINENCYNYIGGATTGCNRPSNEKENVYNLTYGVNNIWGKLYTWSNSSSACPTGRHVPTDAQWEILETTLNGGTNCRNNTDGWLCTGLGWSGHTSKDSTNNIVEALKLPLAGYCSTDGVTFIDRGNYTYLWSSTYSVSDAYLRALRWNSSTVTRLSLSPAYLFSVRCLKN